MPIRWGGPDADSFDIGGETGQITVGDGTELDFESDTKEYIVEATATDIFHASDAVTVTINVTNVSLGTSGDGYDANNNEAIDGDEALSAVEDYFDGIITKEAILQVILLYFSS